MNFELSDEQLMLCGSARAALARTDTLGAARTALDGAEPAHLWETAVRGGWTGLIVDENGPQELGELNAMLVLVEAGRRLAPTGLIGHLTATSLLHAAGHDLVGSLAAGNRRAVYVPARPPIDGDPFLVETGDPAAPWAQPPILDGDLPANAADDRAANEAGIRVSGRVAFVPDLPGAELLVVPVGTTGGRITAVLIDIGGAAGGAAPASVRIEPVTRGDATRPMGHLTLTDAVARPLTVGPAALCRAWDLAQALLAAEALGVCEAVQDLAVGYAKDRRAFGRPIGSYQAVKHRLVDILRYAANVRALLYYAGYAAAHVPGEFTRAAGCARVAGEDALTYATRTCIAVHGGIGATWEHDAHLFYRRALLSRLQYGGDGFAAERVATDLLGSATDRTDGAVNRLARIRL